MDHSGKLKVMGRVIHLVRVQLTGQVGNNHAVLHKNASKTKLGCIAVDVKALGNVGHGQDRSRHKSFLELLEALLALLSPLKLLIFLE
jgi:hypothetical protein